MTCDAETAVLGAALLDGSVADLVGLLPEHFTQADHAAAWREILVLRGAGEPVDIVTVAERCPGTLLARAQGAAPSIRHAPAYAERVLAAYRRREIVAAGHELVESGDPDAAMERLTALARAGTRRTACTLREVLSTVVDALDGKGVATPFVRTGFADLDKLSGGLHASDLVVFGGRPAAGKTALLVNLIGNAAKAGHVVGFISGEQGRMQIAERVLAARGNVSLARMRNQTLDDNDWGRLTNAMAAVRDYRVLIDDLPRPSTREVQATARAWKYRDGLELLCVDYLQLIRAPGADYRLQVGEVAQTLKALARELEIPVVVLAQVKREVDDRPIRDGMGRLPRMSDLAESSLIEQIADQIMTLYRPGSYEDSNRADGEAWLNVCKNRHGPTGLIPLTWIPHSLRFDNAAVAAA